MSVKQPKYIIVEASTRSDLQHKLDTFSEDGYRVHSYTYAEYPTNEAIYQRKYTALLYLDLGNYEGATNIRDVPTSEADDYLAHGWELASASISTKFVRLIYRIKPNEILVNLADVESYLDKGWFVNEITYPVNERKVRMIKRDKSGDRETHEQIPA